MTITDTLSRVSNILEKVQDSTSAIFVDALLDAITSLVQDCSSSNVRKQQNFKNFVNRYEEIKEFIRQNRVNVSDFEEIKVIGRGAYGKVSLVRKKESRKVYAMKQLSKVDMIDKGESACVFEERQIMANAASEWIVALNYSFQDYHNLYMVMEYVPGGNLLKIIEDYDLSEKWAKFYIAEVINAVAVIHGMRYVHRDIKPENILIDIKGHVKLADFGTCVELDEDGFVTSSTAVGTPDYISPEVLQSESSATKYGVECDYWSIGVLIYEILYNDTPFYADSLVGTYAKIMDYKRSLEFPDDVQTSNQAKSVIRGLLTGSKERLGRNGPEELKNHDFFKNTGWTFENIRNAIPPVVPEVKGEIDTQYFDDVVEELPMSRMPVPKSFEGNNIQFIGFTFNGDYGVTAQCYSKNGAVRKSVDDSENIEELKREIKKLKENNVSSTKLNDLSTQELTIRLKETEKKLNSLTIESTDKLESFTAENIKLKQQIATYKENLLADEDQVDYLTKEIGTYKEILSKLQLEYESTIAKLNNDAVVHSNVHKCLVETQTKLADKEILISTTNSRLESTKQEKERLSSENDNLNGHLTRLNGEVIDYKARITEIEYDLSLSKYANDELKDKNTSLAKEINELKSELIDNRQQPVDSQQNADCLELADLKVKYSEMQQKLNDSERRYKQINVLNSAEKARRVVNVREIEGLNVKISNMTEEHNKLKSELHIKENRLSDLQNELTEAQGSLARSEITIENHNILISMKDNKISEVESDIKMKEMLIRSKSDEIAEMKKTQLVMKNKLTMMADELDETKKQAELLTADKTRLEKLVASMETEKEELKYNSAQLKEEADSIAAASHEMISDFKEKNDKFEELERINNEYLMLREKHSALEKSFHVEKIKKEQAVNKLAEISHLKINNMKTGKKGSSNFEVKFKKKEMEFKRLEQEFKQSRQKYESDKKSLQKHVDELLADKTNLELELCSLKATGSQIRSDYISLNSFDFDGQKEGILYTASKNIKRHGWNKKFVIFNVDKLIFYTEKNKETPEMVIDIGKVYHVRAVSQGDVFHANESDVPKIFHIIYASEGIIHRQRASFKSTHTLMSIGDKSMKETSGVINYNDHEMVAITYRKGDITCDMCHKGLSSFFAPSHAMECKTCHVKLHREHVDNNEYQKHCNMPSKKSDVSELLLLAPSIEEQKKWLTILTKSVKDKGYMAKKF